MNKGGSYVMKDGKRVLVSRTNDVFEDVETVAVDEKPIASDDTRKEPQKGSPKRG